MTSKALERQINRLYSNRAIEMRYLWVIITVSNIYNQCRALALWSESSKVFIAFEGIYWILTIFSVTLMSLSLIKKNLKFIRPSVAILVFRNILGIADV